jgi:hypothetical protein
MVGMHGRNIDLVPLQEVTTQSREMTESYYELAYILSR